MKWEILWVRFKGGSHPFLLLFYCLSRLQDLGMWPYLPAGRLATELSPARRVDPAPSPIQAPHAAQSIGPSSREPCSPLGTSSFHCPGLTCMVNAPQLLIKQTHCAVLLGWGQPVPCSALSQYRAPDPPHYHAHDLTGNGGQQQNVSTVPFSSPINLTLLHRWAERGRGHGAWVGSLRPRTSRTLDSVWALGAYSVRLQYKTLSQRKLPVVVVGDALLSTGSCVAPAAHPQSHYQVVPIPWI